MNRLTPEQIDSIVDDVVSPTWKKDAIDSILQKGNDVDQRVSERAQKELFDGLVLKPAMKDVFAKVQHMALEDIHSHRLTYDELMFLFSYTIAKNVCDRIL